MSVLLGCQISLQFPADDILADFSVSDHACGMLCELRAGSCGRQFTCADGKCIPRLYHCNGFVDCLDASDERHCGKSNSAVVL